LPLQSYPRRPNGRGKPLNLPLEGFLNLPKGKPLTKRALRKRLKVEGKICRNLPIMRGAEETILALKERGYRFVCFFWRTLEVPHLQYVEI